MATKSSLINQLVELGLTRSESDQIIQFIVEQIEQSVGQGEAVKIENFGKFELRQYAGREMKNPQTGEIHSIPSRDVLQFSPSDNFIEMINQLRDDGVE